MNKDSGEIMVTRKIDPKYKVRDIDRTRSSLIQAISEMLENRLYKQLTAASLAKWIGMGKNTVSDAFGTMVNLLKTYIAKVDHWNPFFERFQLPKAANDEQVNQLFVELMQHNFKHFSQNREMQNIILWQLNEDSPLLRSISEAREVEGAKLLAMTDRHFKNTDISFRAVIALLLEGCYGLVLHARNNKSSVCGININNERDWRIVYRTIAQVIDRMWDMGNTGKEKNQTKQPKNMNYELVYLEDLVAELVEARKPTDVVLAPDERLVKEVKKVARIMRSHLLNMHEGKVKMYLQINLHTLVALCDLLYDPARKNNPDAEVMLSLLEEIRMDVNKEIPGNLCIPRLFRVQENLKFQDQWLSIRKQMEVGGINVRLIALAGIPFDKFNRLAEKLEWDDFKYLRKYSRYLEKALLKVPASEGLIIDTLIGLGYNETDFIEYYFELMQGAAAEQPEPEAQVVLRRYRKMIKRVVRCTNMRYDPYKKPVVKELTKWIDAELDF